MEFFENILDFIFPHVCGICNKLGEGYICKKCESEIKKYLYLNVNTNLFSLLQYKGIIREKIIQYKFNDKSYLYHMLCELILKDKNACDFLSNYDIIIPVPIHNKRKRQRGYNQSSLIAKELAKKLCLQTYTDVLIKLEDSKPQSLLKKTERIKNVKGVYIVKNSLKIQNKNVVILDDIYTTGATTEECKRVLMLEGAKKVGIITIAKD